MSDNNLQTSITLLHVSDMQFGHNHRFGRLGSLDDPDATFDTLFGRLSIDLDVMGSEGVKPDLLIVSGDLAEWGLPSEFADSLEFIIRLSDKCGISRNRVIIIPGNHDINRKLSEGYFATCEGDGIKPVKPYWPKWKHYTSLFRNFFAGECDVQFDEETPWTLQEIPDKRIIIAALNSTMAECHLDDSHYGFLGERQLRWFADRLESYTKRGWLRIGVIHHNLIRGAVKDEENLRDFELFKQILVPRLNIILHGHTHEAGLQWAENNVPIIATGSAALKAHIPPEEVGNQYQFLRLSHDKFERWTRRYDARGKRWIGDTRSSKDGDVWYTSKEVAFNAVHGTFDPNPRPDPEPKAESIKNEPTLLVQINKPVDAEAAKRQLRKLPRLWLQSENQHRAIRRTEQEKFCDVFKVHQAVWLVADWGTGKDGFLASSLERLGGPEFFTDVYRLHCGSVKTCEELLRDSETQLGMSFQEFFAAVATLPRAILVFDDLPFPITAGVERDKFEQRVRPIFDFCPELKLIFISRQEPKATNQTEVVTLRSLDVPELRLYLRFHTHAQSGLDDSFEVERIYTWSGGLPMHLDRLLERLPFIPLSQILDEYSETNHGSLREPVPLALKGAVAQIADSEKPESRKSYRLLKTLTVLRDGETFQSIKRFYDQDPFYQVNIDELVALALLEDVPISQTATDLSLAPRHRSISGSNAPKLLRVPRQVRDHVNSLISDDERDDIIRNSMGLFFGPQWSSGRVRLRTALYNAYGQSAIAGPGNEQVVARYLLGKALEKRNKLQIVKYSQLAVTYCNKLISSDRFRDALISAGAIVELLRETLLDKEFVETSHVYGRALRMTGNDAEAVDVLQEALQRDCKTLTDDYRASIRLSLALTLQDLKRSDEAISAAQEVIESAHPESGDAYQAHAIVAELTLSGAKRRSRLEALEQAARNKGRNTTANNISLELAGSVKDPNEALRWLNKVIITAKDSYNRARAIIEKVSVLRSHLRISELTPRDRQLLDAAYSYSYAQRIGNLLDRCHIVLWEMFKRENLWSSILRLYRFSSFIWRLRGSDERDILYLRELDSIDVSTIQRLEGQTLHNEILYLERRRRDEPQHVAAHEDSNVETR